MYFCVNDDELLDEDNYEKQGTYDDDEDSDIAYEGENEGGRTEEREDGDRQGDFDQPGGDG